MGTEVLPGREPAELHDVANERYADLRFDSALDDTLLLIYDGRVWPAALGYADLEERIRGDMTPKDFRITIEREALKRGWDECGFEGATAAELINWGVSSGVMHMVDLGTLAAIRSSARRTNPDRQQAF